MNGKKSSYGYTFVFVSDIDHFNWKNAIIEILGNYYDHKSNKKDIEIDPQKITNPNPIKSLSITDQVKVNNYKKQQKELKKK